MSDANMGDPGMTAPTMPSGSYFGRYQLIHRLGRGGMGEVHLARLTGTAGFEKLCVLKTILPEGQGSQDIVERFQHEAKTLVELSHANIAQVYDMGLQGQTLYMALEYIAGIDLARMLEHAQKRGQAVPAPIALFIGQRVAEALAYAHDKIGADGQPLAVIHRDMSPHNVMVSFEGDVKVIDFGLAKSTARTMNTLPLTVMGKLGYMSPEQARGAKIDQKSDVYSCGVIVWEMLAGRPLIPLGTLPEMLAAMSNPTIPSLKPLRPELPETLVAVVDQALNPDPARRSLRGEELAAALHDEWSKFRPLVNARKVGDFARQLCTDEYEQQKRMLSELSVRRAAAELSAESAPRPAVDLDSLKDISFSPPPGPSSSGQGRRDSFSMTPVEGLLRSTAAAGGHIEPTMVRTSEIIPGIRRSPLFVAGGLLLAGAVAGGVYLASRPKTTTASGPVLDAPKPPDSKMKPTASLPAPKLTLSSSSPCEVFSNGTSLGKTPLGPIEVAAGPHALTCRNQFGGVASLDVPMSPGEVKSESFAFHEGKIEFLVLPYADVAVDGHPVGTTPMPPASLVEGTHRVDLTMKAHKIRREVTVKAGATIRLKVNMVNDH